MKRVDEYQRDVVMMSKINQSDERTEKLKRDKVILSQHEVVCVLYLIPRRLRCLSSAWLSSATARWSGRRSFKAWKK